MFFSSIADVSVTLVAEADIKQQLKAAVEKFPTVLEEVQTKLQTTHRLRRNMLSMEVVALANS